MYTFLRFTYEIRDCNNQSFLLIFVTLHPMICMHVYIYEPNISERNTYHSLRFVVQSGQVMTKNHRTIFIVELVFHQSVFGRVESSLMRISYKGYTTPAFLVQLPWLSVKHPSAHSLHVLNTGFWSLQSWESMKVLTNLTIIFNKDWWNF
jgi:hypothetical protein